MLKKPSLMDVLLLERYQKSMANISTLPAKNPSPPFATGD
jgi:hypothetical protein